MRIANDVGPTWGQGGAGNMIAESFATQWFNHVLWQNDPDVFYLRDRYINLSEPELRTLALWDGILGGAVVTSDFPSETPRERLDLWRFLRPGEGMATFPLDWGRPGVPARHLLHGGTAALPRGIIVAVRKFGKDGWGVLAVNPEDEAVTRRVRIADLIGEATATCYDWSEHKSQSRSEQAELVFELPPHHSELVFVSTSGKPPAPDMTLGGWPRH